MPQPGTFGRRVSLHPAYPGGIKRTAESRPPRPAPAVEENVEHPAPAPIIDAPTIDDELRAWRQQRQQHASFRIPWRQLSLMASLCFLIASFVLPASVNDAVDWLLDGLAAISLWVWFSGRRRRSAGTNAAPSKPSSV